MVGLMVSSQILIESSSDKLLFNYFKLLKLKSKSQ